MSLNLITPPSTALVELADVKSHLRVDHSNEDGLIGIYIAAATSYFDGYSGILGRALRSQVWQLTLDSFPSGPIRIPLGPVKSIDAVKYFDPAGVLQTWTPSGNYEGDLLSDDAWVLPVNGWPTTQTAANSVSVVFTAETSPMPAAIQAAALLMIGHMYANREAVTTATPPTELPLGVMALVAPFRRSVI